MPSFRLPQSDHAPSYLGGSIGLQPKWPRGGDIGFTRLELRRYGLGEFGGIMASTTDNASDLAFTAELFKAADKLRGNLEPSEYKHVALGLIFLKYISDAFEGLHAQLTADPHADAEDPEEYLAENVFWVPKEARWSFLQANAKRPEIGKLIDDAMEAIEKAPSNEGLKGVLPKNYARPTLNNIHVGRADRPVLEHRDA